MALFLYMVLLSTLSFAQTNLPELPSGDDSAFVAAQEDHGGHTLMVGLQLLSTWVPSKKTLSYNYNFDDDWSLEGEFSFSSLNDPIPGIDLAGIQERRYTLQARRYFGRSFNLLFGLVISDFHAELDTDVVGQGFTSDFRAQNLGLTGGVANRWHLDNGFTLGIDWLKLNIPLVETKVEDNVLDDVTGSDRDDVKDTIRLFNRIPTFVLLGIGVGYTF